MNNTRINAFTIVLNGMPWLPLASSPLLALPNVHWTIVRGVADPLADTSWCRHIEAPPDDGTAQFLEGVSRHPRVTIIDAPRWPGKAAMCNAALATFTEPGVLLQVDADEVWAEAQLRLLPSLFERFHQCEGALFLCRYWVGPNRYVCTPGAFGNHVDYEWIRAWRFRPGVGFLRHEPPVLDGVAKYIPHSVTTQHGLVFDHYAYAHRSQIEFKQAYYGPQYDPAAWDRLQAMRGSVDISTVLPWVKASVISHEA